ncbi:MAG: 4Fe-4S binding protein [Candidatus Omnitrophota bacterium]
MKRKIIKIDEDKCNGCGSCVPDCAEGALKIIDGKAKLVGEALCDGLGACLGNCPTGALTIEERDVEEFDEGKVKENLKKEEHKPAGGCPGMKVMDFRDKKAFIHGNEENKTSALSQWPVQLKLLSPHAPYFKEADLVIAADCVPFSYPDFHSRFLAGKTLIIFCPKLDDAFEEYVEKLTAIFKDNDIRSITVVRMEVPCCGGTTSIVEEALKKSGKNIVVKECTISIKGGII